MGIRLMYVVLSYIMVRCSISNNTHCLLPLWKVSVVIPHIHVNSLFHIWQILFTVQAVYTWMYWYLTSNCFTAQTYITYLGHFAIWIKVNICLGHLCYCLTLLWYSSICCHSSSSSYSEYQQPVFTSGCQLFWQVWCCGCCCWLLLLLCCWCCCCCLSEGH